MRSTPNAALRYSTSKWSLGRIRIGMLALPALLAAACVLALVAGRFDRRASSAVTGADALISFEDGKEAYWQGIGTAAGTWQAFTDGSRPVGNTTVYENSDSSAADKISQLTDLTLSSPANFIYKANARTNTSGVWLGIVFNRQANGSHYVLRVKSGGTTWELQKSNGTTYTRIGTGNLTAPGGCGTSAVTVPVNTYITLQVERDAASPSTFTLSYGGNVQGSVTDSSSLTGGQVGVYYNGSPALFVNPEVIGSFTVSMAMRVDPATTVAAIPTDAFGSSLHMFGSDNGVSDSLATDADYQTAMAKWFGYLPVVNQIGPTRLRYPGGDQANGLYWVEGIGPIAGRRSDGYFDQSRLPVGTDEALSLAEELGGKGNLIVDIDCLVNGPSSSNSCTRPKLGQPAAVAVAQDWIEYANYPANGTNANGGVDWAAVRAANGHTQPYGVDTWEIGNEVVQTNPATYAGIFNTFATAMHTTDPTLLLGAQDDVFFNTLGNRLLWYQNNGSGVEDLAGANIGFWAHHPYGPSPFFSLIFQKDNSVSISQNLTSAGSYTFTFSAACLNGVSASYPTLSLLVDGVSKWSQSINQPFNSSTNTYPTWQAAVSGLTAGTHTFTVQATGASANQLDVDSLVDFTGAASGSLDLSNSDLFYETLVGTPDAVPTFLGQRVPLEGGHPPYATEWNTIYGIDARPNDQKTAVTNAVFLSNFLKGGVGLANFFPLYGQQQFVGAVEGVAFDPVSKALGRTDPHIRPSGYMLGLARQNLRGNVVRATVAPYGYHFDADDGFLVGGAIASGYREIPNYIESLAALSSSGNSLTLMLVNRHKSTSFPVAINLGSFTPAASGTQIVLNGADVSSNNEIDNSSGGALQVQPVTSALAGVAAQFSYTLPAHSVVFLVLPKSGSNPNPPSAPSSLVASLAGANVNLSWASGGGSIAGYNVYRSRIASGPFGERLNSSPVVTTNFQDTTPERGYTLRYAVKAVDADGRESGLSNVYPVTMPGSAPVWTTPSNVIVTTGTPSGNASALALADGTYYALAAASNAVDFEADFTLPVTAAPTVVAVYYNGTWNAVAKTVHLSLWDWSASAWVEVVNRTDPTNFPSRLIWASVKSTDLTRFVNGSFQVKARVNIPSAGTGTLSSDFFAVQART